MVIFLGGSTDKNCKYSAGSLSRNSFQSLGCICMNQSGRECVAFQPGEDRAQPPRAGRPEFAIFTGAAPIASDVGSAGHPPTGATVSGSRS